MTPEEIKKQKQREASKRYKDKNRDKIRSYNKYYKEKLKKEFPDKIKQYNCDYYKNNKTKRNENTKKWVSGNTERRKEIVRKSNNKNRLHRSEYKKICRKELKKSYLKSLIQKSCELTFSDIPENVILVKRKEIELQRLINNKTKKNEQQFSFDVRCFN